MASVKLRWVLLRVGWVGWEGEEGRCVGVWLGQWVGSSWVYARIRKPAAIVVQRLLLISNNRLSIKIVVYIGTTGRKSLHDG